MKCVLIIRHLHDCGKHGVCHGKHYFSHWISQRYTRKEPYPTITAAQIEALVESPHSREKADAVVHPSSYSGGWARTHLVQQEVDSGGLQRTSMKVTPLDTAVGR